MKKYLKLLSPIVSVSTLLTPLTLSSCAEVYEDVNVVDYTPDHEGKYDNLRPRNVTWDSSEATKNYFEALGKDINWLKLDLYWSCHEASIHHETIIDQPEKRNFKFNKYLINISNMEYKKECERNLLSFKVTAQIESTYNQIFDGEVKKSYEINSYVYDYSFNKIEFVADIYKSYEESKPYWYLKPIKYHPELSGQESWDALVEDEQIVYNIRQITKGYSEDGVQNFSNEQTKAAIIDNKHKYTPALDAQLTSFLLNWSWYLSDVTYKK